MGAVDRHPHLAEPRRPAHVRVDCHSHTMWSGDSTTTPEELVEVLADTDIDVLCITDHHAVEGAVRLRDALPCRVVVGEEVRTHAGELIGLFLDERVPQGLPADETARRIRDQGALVYVPHPFDPMRRCLDEGALFDLIDAGLVDALEGHNGKVSLEHLNVRARDIAAEAGLPCGAGSDAHVAEALGAGYVEMPDFDDAPSFLAALGSGRLVGHHYDPVRRWRPRVIPGNEADT